MISRILSLKRPSLFFVGLIAAAMAPCAFAQQSLANHLTKRVVGDYVYGSKYNNPPYGAAQIPYHKLTHINHAGVSFDAYGNLSMPPGFIEPELNHRAHAAGVKVMLLLRRFPGARGQRRHANPGRQHFGYGKAVWV